MNTVTDDYQTNRSTELTVNYGQSTKYRDAFDRKLDYILNLEIDRMN
jgi:hypothetical protein